MALITARTSSATVAVLSGTVMMPLYGAWTADIVLDNPGGEGFGEGTTVDLVATDGFTLSGTVAPARTGDFLDATHVRLIGGKGGMGATATAKGYVQPSAFVRDVVNGLMNDSGESLSSTASQSFLTTNLTAWMVTARPVSECLDVLIEMVAPSMGWRMLADGTLWIGEESWPDSGVQFELLSKDPVEGFYDLGVASPSIGPGVTIADVGRVSRVEHTIESDRIRSRVWVPTEQQQGVADYLEKIVDHRMAKIDYLALYDAEVKSQSADLTTVDLDVKDPRIGGLQRVPLRNGLAACAQQVANGSKIRLGWDRGDPRRPFAAMWDGGESVTRLKLGGNTDAARKDDPVTHGTIAFSFDGGSGSATLSITYTPGDGSSVQTVPTGTGTITVHEKILSGSSVVGLG